MNIGVGRPGRFTYLARNLRVLEEIRAAYVDHGLLLTLTGEERLLREVLCHRWLAKDELGVERAFDGGSRVVSR